MDDGQQELNPQQPEDADQKDKVVDFQKIKGSQGKNQQDGPQKEDQNDEAAQERLKKVRELTELAKGIQAQEANREFTPEQNNFLRRLKDEYSKENNTVSLEEAIDRDFTPKQAEELRALQEIHQLENTWQHGEKVLDIRDYFGRKPDEDKDRFVTNHSPSGEEIIGSVKPWEGKGEIVAVIYKNKLGEERKPGSVQLVYKVDAPAGNHINQGKEGDRKITITIRNPRSSRPQNEGRLYILDSETDPKTGEKEVRQFDSENIKPLKEGDMDQEQAMDTLQLVVDAYDDSVEHENAQEPPKELPKAA